MLAFVGVTNALFQQALHRADRAGQNTAAFPSHRAGEKKGAAALFAEEIFRRHLAVLEEHLRHRRGAHAHLLDLVRGVQPRRIFVDQKSGDAIGTARLIDVGKDDNHICDRAVGDENLAPVQDVFVALFRRGCAEGEGIGAAVRFAHGVAADQGAVAKAGQIFFLLRLGPVVNQRDDRGPHMGVDREEQAIVFAGVAVGIGERDFHAAAEEKEASRPNTVSDQASTCARITVQGNQMTPNQITVPKALVCNILFTNEDDGVTCRLVVQTGDGTQVETGAVEGPARQVLTLRIVNAGVYEMTVEGDGGDITGSVTAL